MADGTNKQTTLDLSLRDQLWHKHPIILARAVLPTPAVASTIAIVLKAARTQRNSCAFWAHPLSGKSSCVRSLESVLAQQFPGCGVFIYETKRKRVCAEGALLEDILSTMNYEPKLQRSLSGKRDQTTRALYAFAAPRGHLFIIVDEAQDLHEEELCWLKNIINWLVGRDCQVTVVLFGQQELLTLRDGLLAKGRSDLYFRYMSEMYEFENVRNADDLAVIFLACDEKSEFPRDSGCSYTRFLWPQAFDHGVRLRAHALTAWKAFASASLNTRCEQGVSINWVAKVLAELAWMTKDDDRAGFDIGASMWSTAIALAGYRDEPFVRLRKVSRKKTK